MQKNMEQTVLSPNRFNYELPHATEIQCALCFMPIFYFT